MEGFLQRHPKFKGRPLWLSGESYGAQPALHTRKQLLLVTPATMHTAAPCKIHGASHHPLSCEPLSADQAEHCLKPLACPMLTCSRLQLNWCSLYPEQALVPPHDQNCHLAAFAGVHPHCTQCSRA